jgi:hypothetical protein
MTERYRGFNICGGAEAVLEALLRHISQWSPTGSIDYVRPRRSVVELARFRLPSMTVNDKVVSANAARPTAMSCRFVGNVINCC